MFPRGCATLLKDGFSIRIVNAIAPLKIVRSREHSNLEKVLFKVDEEILNIRQFYLKYQSILTPYEDLTPLHGCIVNVGDTLEVIFKGKTLSPGWHLIEVKVDLPNPVQLKVKLHFQKNALLDEP